MYFDSRLWLGRFSLGNSYENVTRFINIILYLYHIINTSINDNNLENFQHSETTSMGMSAYRKFGNAF